MDNADSCRILALFIVLVAMLPFAAAQLAEEETPPFPPGDFTVTLSVKEANTLRGFPNQALMLTVSGNGIELKGVFQTTQASAIQLSLDAGEWKITGEVDDAATPGKDWAGTVSFRVENQSAQTLFLEPVSSVMGEVLEGNRTVPNAKVSLMCPGSFHDPAALNDETRTGETGSFEIKRVPAGSCKIIASTDSKSGASTVNSKQGEVNEVAIVLGKETAAKETPWLFVAIAIMLIAGAAVFAYLTWFGKPAPFRKAVGKRKAAAPRTGLRKTKKMASILGSLTEREKQVAEFILREGGKTTQAKIYRALLLPKVSLSRLIDSLERRNIIAVKPFGKTNGIELTKWFSE